MKNTRLSSYGRYNFNRRHNSAGWTVLWKYKNSVFMYLIARSGSFLMSYLTFAKRGYVLNHFCSTNGRSVLTVCVRRKLRRRRERWIG